MGKASDLTELEKSKIIALRQEGASLRQISLSVGRSVNAVKLVNDKFCETGTIGKREVKKLRDR